jgi:hypothetical protein
VQTLLEYKKKVAPGPLSEQTQDQRKAADYIQARVNEMMDEVKGLDPNITSLRDLAESGLDMNFSKFRRKLGVIQNDMMDREVPGHKELGKVFGGSGEGLRTIADDIAARNGSLVPEINKQISEGLNLAKQGARHLSENKIENAFTGVDNAAKRTTKQALDLITDYANRSSSMVDNINTTKKFGIENTVPKGDFVGDFRSGALAGKTYNTYLSNLTPGSAKAISEGSKQAFQTGAKRAGQAFAGTAGLLGMAYTPYTVPAAFVAGATEGFAKGSRAGSPQIALDALQGATQRLMKKVGPERYSNLIEGGVDEISGAAMEGGASGLRAGARVAQDLSSGFASGLGDAASPASLLRRTPGAAAEILTRQPVIQSMKAEETPEATLMGGSQRQKTMKEKSVEEILKELDSF